MSELTKLARALEFCVQAHRCQFRDGEAAVPYACHPVEVMLTLRHQAGVLDEEHLCAALLHDTVEDTDASLLDLRKEFGERVAEIVGEVTRDEPERPEGMDKHEHWMMKTGLFLEEIRGMSWEAKMIKLSDRLSNIRESEATRSGYKLERYRLQTIWILQEIPRDTHPGLWDAIAAVIDQDAASVASAPRYPES
jgi:(p)ppGpp synthase/HD superfamily hydrolase